MVERYGVIFIDEFELVLRIYETTNNEWKLVYYYSKNFAGVTQTTLKDGISTTITSIFSEQHAQHIAEWKLCARAATNNVLNEITNLTGLPVEVLTQTREQELLCKGMFTELW